MPDPCVIIDESVPTLTDVVFVPIGIASVSSVPNSSGCALVPIEESSPKPDLPSLTTEQDSFALAYIEHGGNTSLAYKDVFGKGASQPNARGQELLALPQVAARIRQLSANIKEVALVSLGMHLQELAEIRDLAKIQGQLKVALSAERTRGEVTGLYDRFEHGSRNANNTPTNIQINLVSKYDVNI